MIYHDSIEQTEEFKEIEEELERLIVEEIGEQHYFGYCHTYWKTKKRILKEKYGIDWKSPAELNPHIIFD